MASALVALETRLHRALRAYQGVDLFLVPSLFMKQVMLRAGLSESRIRLVPHCIPLSPDANTLDDALFENLRKPFFLYAGRLEPEKGLNLLVQAAHRLHDAHFVIAGSGSLEGWIADQAASLDNVTMLGMLDSHQLAAIRREARAELAPSTWYEVFGMSVLEAMHAGLPVIAGNIGGLPDLVRDGETGLLIPPGDVDALVAAISRLQYDASLAAGLGAAGKEFVHRRHQPEQHLAQLLSLYREAAAIRGTSGRAGGAR